MNMAIDACDGTDSSGDAEENTIPVFWLFGKTGSGKSRSSV